jgi:prevent-host-death family protein
MKTAAVSELKALLSQYLDRVKAGEEVRITDRGNPVARLLAISRATARRDTMENMEKRGLTKLGPGRLPKGFWAIPRPRDPGGSVLQALLEKGRRVDEILGFVGGHSSLSQRTGVGDASEPGGKG